MHDGNDSPDADGPQLLHSDDSLRKYHRHFKPHGVQQDAPESLPYVTFQLCVKRKQEEGITESRDNDKHFRCCKHQRQTGPGSKASLFSSGFELRNISIQLELLHRCF